MRCLELLTLNFAGLDRLFSERLESGLLLQRKTECFHAANQPSLLMAHCGQRAGEAVLIQTASAVARVSVISPDD